MLWRVTANPFPVTMNRSRSEPPMYVSRFDCDTRFLVRSAVREDVHYLVDLVEKTCSCDDTQFRPDKRNCKHRRRVRAVIDAARWYCEQNGLPMTLSLIGNAHR